MKNLKVLTTSPPGTTEWHEKHRGKLGSTDFASFFRYGKDDGPELAGKRIGSKSELELFLEMTGRKQPTDLSEVPAVMRGVALEPVILKLYSKQSGRTVLPSVGLVQHPTLDFVACTPDAHTHNEQGEDVVVDAKSANPMKMREAEQQGISKKFRIQGEALLWTLEVRLAVFTLYCMDRDEVLPFEFEADPELQQMMGERATEFIEKHVKKDIPPQADHDDLSNVKVLYPREFKGKKIKLSPAQEVDAQLYLDLASQKTELDHVREELQARILGWMQDAEYAEFADGSALRARVSHRKAYTVKETVTRPLIRVAKVGN